MAKRKQADETDAFPTLTVPRDQAGRELTDQMEAGEKIKSREIRSQAQLDEAGDARQAWKDFVTLMLRRYFTTQEFARSFSRSWKGHYQMNPSSAQRAQDFLDDMQASMSELQSIINRLDLLDEPSASTVSSPPAPVANTTDVFIVHGHDEAVLQTVARFVEKLRLNPIILHEQPNRGRTIIEKFEGHSAVGFAVVLLTPDDVGGVDATQLRWRARQNVILELGFFCGSLGRSRVCALHKGDIELPSDFDGVLYVPFDDAGGWKAKLAKELAVAGLDVDLAKVVS